MDIKELSEKVMSGMEKAMQKLVEESARNDESLIIGDENGHISEAPAKELLVEMQGKKKVAAIVETSATGFGVYSERLPGITGYGKTVEKAKEDFVWAIEETRDAYGGNVPGFLEGVLEIEYSYDVGSMFDFVGVLDVERFGNKVGVDVSLLRRCITGDAEVSANQKEKIQEGLHESGWLLLSVRL